MSTTKSTTVEIKSADLKGSASIRYISTTLLQDGPIVIRWAGSSLNFNTVSEFLAFTNDVLFPSINTVFNASGIGNGGSVLPNPYVASTDTLVN